MWCDRQQKLPPPGSPETQATVSECIHAAIAIVPPCHRPRLTVDRPAWRTVESSEVAGNPRRTFEVFGNRRHYAAKWDNVSSVRSVLKRSITIYAD